MVLSFLLCSIVSAEKVEEFLISESSRVTDGSVFVKGKCQFDQTTLNSLGVNGSNYSRVLIKFDLADVDPGRFAKVSKAYLKLYVTKAVNPEKKKTEICVMNVPWKSNQVTFKEAGNGKAWPTQKGMTYCNIDDASEEFTGNSQIILHKGFVKFDVTEIVNRWLYEGKENYGFFVKTGPRVSGLPMIGSWDIQIASSRNSDTAIVPVLEVIMEGDAPKADEQEISLRTIQWFPSALLPPVSKPYYILQCFWGGHGKLFWDDYKHRAMNIDGVFCKDELLQRGILSLSGVKGPNTKWHNTTEALKKYYSHPIGIAIDEWQQRDSSSYMYKGKEILCEGFGKKIDYALDALRLIEKEVPETFTCVYWRGEKSLLELSNKSLPDLVVVEGYSHTTVNPRWSMSPVSKYFSKVELAKENDMLSQTIIMLGTIAAPYDYLEYYKDNPLTPEMLEVQIQTIREKYPEMPGIGFYVYTPSLKTFEEREANEELKALMLAADRLAWKYYIKPAPEVVITIPAYNEVLTHPHILLKAEAKGQDGRGIIQYRWFVDNRLMAETENNVWMWDVRGEFPGNHIITVHAIDSAYNRAATQIPVIVNVKQK